MLNNDNIKKTKIFFIKGLFISYYKNRLVFKSTQFYFSQLFRLQHENEIKKNDLDESREISQYMMNCVRICWLFAIQDPPMKLHWPKEETEMDEHVVAYTKSGTRIKFVVWPTLYLHDKGPVMTKGVAQPF